MSQDPLLAHLPAFIALPIDALSTKVGMGSDVVRFVGLFLLTIPLGYVHKHIPSVFLKHVTSVVLGLLYCFFQVGPNFYHNVLSALIAYAMISVLLPISPSASSASKSSSEPLNAEEDKKRRAKDRQRAGALVFIFSLGYMSACHIHRLYYDYMGYTIDYTAPQMMITLKMVSFAWARVDGEAINDDDSSFDPSKANSVVKHRSSRALRKMPSILEYMSFMFFFPAVLAGPVMDMSEFTDFVEVGPKKFKLESHVPTAITSATCVLNGFLCVGLHQAGKIFFPITNTSIYSPAFLDLNIVYKMAYIFVGAMTVRCKYYFAWYMAEAGCVSSGVGMTAYDAKTGVAEWKGVINCRFTASELGLTSSSLTSDWNIRVADWMKNFVYFRAGDLGFSRTYANVATKVTSAFWHGFYPGYYMFFVPVALFTEAEGVLRTRITPIFYDMQKNAKGVEEAVKFKFSQPVYYLATLVHWTVMYVGFDYFAISFMLLSFQDSLHFYRSTYFLGHLVCVSILVIDNVARKLGRKKASKDTTDAAVTKKE